MIVDVQSQGIGWWQALKDTEIYGACYLNAPTTLTTGSTPTTSGNKVLRDSLIFDNASHGLHAYAENADKGDQHHRGRQHLLQQRPDRLTETRASTGFKRNILLRADTGQQPGGDQQRHPPGKSVALNLATKPPERQVTGNYFAGGAGV